MIKNMDLKEILFELCKVEGVSGSEEPAIEVAKKYFQQFCKVSTDINGSLLAVAGNENAEKTLLIDAHIDRIGLIVTDIDDRGFVMVDKCGGVDLRTLQDSELVLQGNPSLTGVVCCMPPHLSDGKEDKANPIDKTYVDFGMPYDEISKYMSSGDVLTFKSNPVMLLNNRVASAGLDNRCSVATLVRVAENLADKKDLKYKVVFLLSSQEETFGAGAKTASFTVEPDEAIVVDVSFASQPDVSGQYSKIELDKGAMICISPILSREMSKKLINLAEKRDIPYQFEPISGVTGTNADSISVTKGGVKTAVVSIPQRNMHTPGEIISLNDVENTARLITEYILDGGAFNG